MVVEASLRQPLSMVESDESLALPADLAPMPVPAGRRVPRFGMPRGLDLGTRPECELRQCAPRGVTCEHQWARPECELRQCARPFVTCRHTGHAERLAQQLEVFLLTVPRHCYLSAAPVRKRWTCMTC